MTPKKPGTTSEETVSTKRVSTRLLALSSAAVVAVYAAGYWRTKAAAERLESAGAGRRPAPAPEPAAPVVPQPAPSSVALVLPTRPAPDRTPAVATTPAPVSAQAPTSSAPAAVRPQPSTEAPATTPAPAALAPIAANEPAAVPAAPPLALTTAVATPTPQLQVPDAPAPPKPLSAYKDGTYLGWGTCRHGDIQAEVVVAAGRITSAKIAQCWTRYSCNWLDGVVPQVVTRQSPNVDYVSGATQSVDAFYWAVTDALAKAK